MEVASPLELVPEGDPAHRELPVCGSSVWDPVDPSHGRPEDTASMGGLSGPLRGEDQGKEAVLIC